MVVPLEGGGRHSEGAAPQPSEGREERPTPPIGLEQATGFGMFMIKAVLRGRGDEIVDLAKTNLWR